MGCRKSGGGLLKRSSCGWRDLEVQHGDGKVGDATEGMNIGHQIDVVLNRGIGDA